MSLSKKQKITVWGIISQMRLSILFAAVVGVAVLAAFIGIEVTSQSGFCNSCHIMNDYYASWQRSTHSEVECLKCHLQPGFGNYMLGKINGLAQSVDCMVGRVGTIAEATVFDVSCLRSACHSVEELLQKESRLGKAKFTHKGHIQETIDGIHVSCSTCHNHIGGEEHFSVNREVCYTCHFTRSPQTESGLVENKCLDCHDIPEKTIERGLVKVNHQEFVSYQASCEESCHKRQIEHVSDVSDVACLQCHTFGLSPEDTSEHLHAAHTEGEKVECLACHGQVPHGPDKSSTVATMFNCENCHSNTHGIQRTIFTADRPISHIQNNDKVLSPMFLTHVECTGCHIERTSSATGTLDSLGTVVRAVPRACDNCHEPGTGDRYVPFWQKRIKELYTQAREKISKIKADSQQLASLDQHQQVERASELLDSIQADGSWGVHNLKYTEALLRQVDDMIKQVE